MPVVARLVVPVPEVLQVALQVIEEVRLDRGQELRLVVLDGDHAVAAAGDDLLDDLLLAAHRVDRDQRAGQVDLLQELRDGRDLVGLGVGGDLAQRDPLLAGPGADDVQGAEALAPRRATGDRSCRRWRRGVSGSSASVGIASPIQAWKQRWNASGFSAMSRRRMQSREGMPLGKARCWASQDCAMLGPAMDGGGAIAPADDAADGDDGDIDQEVLAIARVPRVGERFEVRADGADVDELGHGRHPGIGRCGPPRRTGGSAATRARGPEPRYRAEARRARLPRPHSYTRGPWTPSPPTPAPFFKDCETEGPGDRRRRPDIDARRVPSSPTRCTSNSPSETEDRAFLTAFGVRPRGVQPGRVGALETRFEHRR